MKKEFYKTKISKKHLKRTQDHPCHKIPKTHEY